MRLQNINSSAIGLTEPGQGVGVMGLLEAEIPKMNSAQIRGIVEAHSNFSPVAVDPLAYYCALVLITGIDELLSGGGYCQVGGRRCLDLGETIRVWGEWEAGQ
jgi:hypothetical protein